MLHCKNFKIKKGSQSVLTLGFFIVKMAKNGHVHEAEGGKEGRNNAIPTKLFSVDSYERKFMPFKFGNDIFITFEMPFGKLTFHRYSVHL